VASLVAQVTPLPQVVDLALYAGDDFAAVLTLDGTLSTAGASVLSQVRPGRDSNVVLAEFGASVSGQAVTLTLPGAATEGLAGALVWDCQLTLATGLVRTVAGGSLAVTRDVTRS
jgi:hypothetical protein